MNDFLLDTNLELTVANGDFVTGISDQQQQNLLLMIGKGELKENPSVGVGIYKFLESEDKAGLLREISIQFSADGMNVKSVGLNNVGNIVVDAPY